MDRSPEEQIEPELLEEMEEMLAPYRAFLSSEAIEAMREELLAGVTEHSVGRSMLRQSRARTAPDRSEEIATGKAVEPIDEKKRKGAGRR